MSESPTARMHALYMQEAASASYIAEQANKQSGCTELIASAFPLDVALEL